MFVLLMSLLWQHFLYKTNNYVHLLPIDLVSIFFECYCFLTFDTVCEWTRPEQKKSCILKKRDIVFMCILPIYLSTIVFQMYFSQSTKKQSTGIVERSHTATFVL